MAQHLQRTVLFLFLCITVVIPVHRSHAISLDLLSLSTGSWIVTPPESDRRIKDGEVRNEYALFFNKAVAQGYFTMGAFKGFVSIPVSWTYERQGAGNFREQIWFSDIDAYVGKKHGLFEPRLGLRIPTGYSTKKAYIGSGNVLLLIGLGIYSDLRDSKAFNLSGEIMYRQYIPGGSVQGFSWELSPSIKASIRPKERTNAGAEILATVSKTDWSDTYSVTKVTLVPHLFGEFDLTNRLVAFLKTGYGFDAAKERGDTESTIYTVLSISAGVNIFNLN